MSRIRRKGNGYLASGTACRKPFTELAGIDMPLYKPKPCEAGSRDPLGGLAGAKRLLRSRYRISKHVPQPTSAARCRLLGTAHFSPLPASLKSSHAK
jgi:hypothetical protein